MADLNDINMWAKISPSAENELEQYKKQTIKTLIRQSARFSAAATQDKSPLIALLHANYGATYLWALRDIATDEEIKKYGNIDIISFKNKITDIQDKATKLVSAICPKFIGQVEQDLMKLAGDI
jgi:hypothetical protein